MERRAQQGRSNSVANSSIFGTSDAMLYEAGQQVLRTTSYLEPGMRCLIHFCWGYCRPQGEPEPATTTTPTTTTTTTTTTTRISILSLALLIAAVHISNAFSLCRCH